MQKSVKSLLFAVMLFLSPAVSFADFYTQINGPGQTTLFSGATSALSVYDTNPVTAPDLPLAAIAYDNFSVATSGALSSVQWTGTYEDGSGLNKHADAFQITFYTDNAGAVGTQIAQFTTLIGAVSETALGGDHYLYTYAAPANFLPLTGGTQYWMSVVAEIPYNTPSPAGNAWGWAFNNSIGDDNSYQQTQTGPVSGGFYTYDTFNDPVDYSFAITSVAAVPEPSSCLLLAGAVGGIAVRKWRKRRVAAK